MIYYNILLIAALISLGIFLYGLGSAITKRLAFKVYELELDHRFALLWPLILLWMFIISLYVLPDRIWEKYLEYKIEREVKKIREERIKKV